VCPLTSRYGSIFEIPVSREINGAVLGGELVLGVEDKVPVVVPSGVEDEMTLLPKFLMGNPLLLLPSSKISDSGAPTLVATFNESPDVDLEGGYLTIV
jgi:hypothetical protein